MGGTYPNTTTASLHLLLGYVAEGAMTATGTLLTITAGGGIVFTSADVGARIMVLGASTFGAPLFTTIASFTDGQNVNLTLPAATSVTATSQNVVLFRETKTATDYPVSGSVRFAQTLQARDTFSFQFVSRHSSASPSTTFAPAEGQPVLLVDDVLGEIFGGTIDQVVITNMPGDQGIFADCIGITYDLLLSRKTTGIPTGAGSPPQPNNGVFTNQTLAQIATYLVSLAAADGVTISTVTGPVIPSYQVSYATLYDALDQVCQLASNATAQYKWFTDPRRVVHIVQIGTLSAPFNVSYTDASDQNILQLTSSGGTQGGFSSTQTRQNYANKAIVKVGNLSIGVLTEVLGPGNGALMQFETSAPLGAAPQISIVIASPLSTIPQTVGVLGIDTGKQWYWNLGSNVITQDSSGTPLTSQQSLAVTYQGIDKGVVINSNSAEITRRAAVEGGTGIYEVVQDAGTPASLADAQTLAAAIANSLGVIPETVTYGIYRGGLTVGMTQRIDILQLGVSDNFVIDSVTMTTANNLVLWQITATRGPTVLNWQNMLQSSIGNASSPTGVGVPTVGAEPVTAITPVRQWIQDVTGGPHQQNSWQPVPFRYNNRLYYAASWADPVSGFHHFSVFESTDDGRTWSAIDDANAPSAGPSTSNVVSGCVCFDGAQPALQGAGGYILHCMWVIQNNVSPPNQNLNYQSFNLGTRTWNTAAPAIGPAAQSVGQVFVRQSNNRLFVTYDAGNQSVPTVQSRYQGISFDLNAKAFGSLAVDIGAELAIGTGNGNACTVANCTGVIDPATGRLHFFIVSSNFGTYLWQAIETNDSRGSFFFFIKLGLGPPLGNFWLPGNAIVLNGRLMVGIVTKESGPQYNYRVLVSADLIEADLTQAGNWATTQSIADLNSNQFVAQGASAFPAIAGDLRGIMMLIHSLDNTTLIDKISFAFTVDIVNLTAWSQLDAIWDFNVDTGPPPSDNGFLSAFGFTLNWLSRDITDAARSRAFVIITPRPQSVSGFQDVYVGYVEWDAVTPV